VNDESRAEVASPAATKLHGLVLVVGGRGSGKTTFLQGLVRRHALRGFPFVVWDRLGNFLARPRVHVLRACSPEQAAAEALRRAPCTLVLDEVDLGVPSYRPLVEGSALAEIIHLGRQASAEGPWRRKGPVALIGACRLPYSVRKDLRGLADRIYFGRMHEPADLKWVEEVAGSEVAMSLPELTPGQFILHDCS
jgi:hypothetical protein